MVSEIIYEFFCRPILDPSVRGYNLVNTATYAAILILVSVFVIYPFLKRSNVKMNFRFMLSLLPYVIFGSAFRVLNDIGIFEKTCNPFTYSFYTFTPGIWFLTAALALGGIALAGKLARDENSFYRYFGATGILAAAPVVIYEFTIFGEWAGFLAVLAAAAAITFATKAIVELKYRGFFTDRLNMLVVAGQVLDGSATYVATEVFTCGEQHPLSALILGIHPALFILIKVAIALLIIHALDQDIKDENMRNFIKVGAIILGFATGTRDALTLAVGTCS